MKRVEAGNVLFYVFLAVGLMAAITYAFVKDSRQGFSSEIAMRSAEDLFSQANLLRSAVQQCAMEYPEGGGDLNHDNNVDTTDNPNNPYPLKPTSPLNPNAPAGIAAASNDEARNLTCVGAPAGSARMFEGDGSQGRFLPPPPSGFSEWIYVNDTDGVYFKITADNIASATAALDRLYSRFTGCQAALNFNGCGTRCFAVFVVHNNCP